jgi:hypothetical protein
VAQKKWTAKGVAKWMAQGVKSGKYLYQETCTYEIIDKFGLAQVLSSTFLSTACIDERIP